MHTHNADSFADHMIHQDSSSAMTVTEIGNKQRHDTDVDKQPQHAQRLVVFSDLRIKG